MERVYGRFLEAFRQKVTSCFVDVWSVSEPYCVKWGIYLVSVQIKLKIVKKNTLKFAEKPEKIVKIWNFVCPEKVQNLINTIKEGLAFIYTILRLSRCLKLPDNRTVKLRKHKVIAQAYGHRKRKGRCRGRSRHISFSYQSSHDDPLGKMAFCMKLPIQGGLKSFCWDIDTPDFDFR